MFVLFALINLVTIFSVVLTVVPNAVFLLIFLLKLSIFVLFLDIAIAFFESLKILIKELILLGQLSISSFKQRIFHFFLFESILNFTHVMIYVFAIVKRIFTETWWYFVWSIINFIFFLYHFIHHVEFLFVLMIVFWTWFFGISAWDWTWLMWDSGYFTLEMIGMGWELRFMQIFMTFFLFAFMRIVIWRKLLM